MENKKFIIGVICAVSVVSCSIHEADLREAGINPVFYASIEQPSEEDGTRVYVNQDYKVLWDEGDKVSIFNLKDANDEYRFTGKTGDNGGSFELVKDFSEEGVSINHRYAVYPYSQSTSIDMKGTLSVSLPAEQYYRESSFGPGANMMVAATDSKEFQFKNACGYLVLKLYGEGVSVSSITLKGNNGERLAGKATITMPLEGVPTVTMADEATTEITLICADPVQLGATEKESTQFWFVVPPMSFSKGFTVSVNLAIGGSNEVSTSKSIDIERNRLSKMSPTRVDWIQPNNVIVYTSSNGEVVTPYKTDGFGANLISNEYVGGRGIFTFDGDVTAIGDASFYQCSGLTSIILPRRVNCIGANAFKQCSSLTSIQIPEGVKSIGQSAFSSCSFLSSIIIPNGVTSIDDWTFYDCRNLKSITIPDSVTSIGQRSFRDCFSLTSISIPESVTSIGELAFQKCVSLKSINIPESVTSIGLGAFIRCTSLSSFSGKFASKDGLFLIDSGAVFAVAFGAIDGVFSIPDYVTRIEVNAFYGCTSLTRLTIPDSVTSIGYDVFTDCTNLVSVTVLSETPPTAVQDMFGNNPFGFLIFVPPGSVNDYKKAQYWNKYANYIRPIPSSTIPVPEVVDLGLSVKWASFNLGASKPEEFGDYYAWGETAPYYEPGYAVALNPVWKPGKESGYVWTNYKWCKGYDCDYTKYCNNSSYGYNGFTDGKTVLEPEDDAAHVNLGGNWRIPTNDELIELRDQCTWEWTTINGIPGSKVTGPNWNSIFLPAARFYYGTGCGGFDVGSYWSSSTYDSHPQAVDLYFSKSENYISVSSRYYGRSIRPVYVE